MSATQHCLQACCPGTVPAPGHPGPALSSKLLAAPGHGPRPLLFIVSCQCFTPPGLINTRPAITSPIVWVLLSVAKLFERCRSVVSRTIWILKTQVDWALAPLFTCLHVQGPTPQQSTPGFYVRMLPPSGHIVSSVSSCSLTSVSPFLSCWLHLPLPDLGCSESLYPPCELIYFRDVHGYPQANGS